MCTAMEQLVYHSTNRKVYSASSWVFPRILVRWFSKIRKKLFPLTLSWRNAVSIFNSRYTLLHDTVFWKTLGIFFKALRVPSLGSTTDLYMQKGYRLAIHCGISAFLSYREIAFKLPHECMNKDIKAVTDQPKYKLWPDSTRNYTRAMHSWDQ